MKNHAVPWISLALGISAQGGPEPHPAMTTEPSIPDRWEFAISTYSPLMGLEGNAGIGGIAVPVDIPFEDILEELDGGAVLALEARKDRWSIGADFIWLKLSSSGEPFAQTRVHFRQEEIISSLTMGYELFGSDSTSLELLAGGALTSVDINLEVFTPRLPVTYRSGSGTQTWIDPFVGLRLRHRFSERWSVWIRGDYGGFDISSEEYWQAVAGISCRLGDHVSLALAYRAIGVDYRRGGFIYDTEMAGPNLGLAFHF